MSTQVTKNFTLEEFFCKCDACKKKAPPKDVQANIIKLIHELQPERDRAQIPFNVNCGYRCKAHNEEVGGVSNSVHMTGLAADITIGNLTSEQMFEFMSGIKATFATSGMKPKRKFKGVGYYPPTPKRGPFVHVDLGLMHPRPNTWKG